MFLEAKSSSNLEVLLLEKRENKERGALLRPWELLQRAQQDRGRGKEREWLRGPLEAESGIGANSGADHDFDSFLAHCSNHDSDE